MVRQSDGIIPGEIKEPRTHVRPLMLVSAPSNDDESHDKSSETDGALVVQAQLSRRHTLDRVDNTRRSAPLLHRASQRHVISNRKFQKMSGLCSEIYINSVTSERQSSNP